MKVHAVNIDISDDGTAYTVTATPWPTIDNPGHPYTAKLVHTRHEFSGPERSEKLHFAASWTDRKLASFVKKLIATYPKVSV